MKRTWILACMAVLGLTAFAGVTMALFTATTTKPAVEDFVAGTLAIDGQRDQGDSVPGPMFYFDGTEGKLPDGYWAPGDTVHKVLQVQNIGSLDALLMSITAKLDSGSSTLADKLHVVVSTDPSGANVVAEDALSAFYGGKAFKDPIPAFAGATPDEGDVIDLHFFVSLPKDADNAYQNLTAEVSFSVYAEQMKNHP